MRKIKPLAEYNLWDHYLGVIRSAGDFSGRSTRSAFWGYYLFYYLFFIVWGVFCKMFGGIYTGALLAVYQLFFLLPTVALMFRRLHDTGRSGWYTLPIWVLLVLVLVVEAGLYSPYKSGITVIYILGFLAGIASLCLFVIMGFFKSGPGRNEYGPNPYGVPRPPRLDEISTVEI
ncbi:MAG: DUF805 domain-containing protein [Betaproteobacteria bacterium]|nr:DUF805 domain-containing protein [Betaproteobacteria bacterium]